MEEEPTTDQSKWGAKQAFLIFLAILGGVIGASFFIGIIFGILTIVKIDVLDLPFPSALFSIPLTEGVILVITIIFVMNRDAGRRELGLKRASSKILLIAAAAAVPLFFLSWGIDIVQTVVFGPNPQAELLTRLTSPRDVPQLIMMILMNLVLVGPIEELAYRGFVQKGFENSFGKAKGLLITSALFGITHVLNSPYNVAPALVGGLVLGFVWQRTGGNTIVSATMHGVYNSTAFILSFFLT